MERRPERSFERRRSGRFHEGGDRSRSRDRARAVSFSEKERKRDLTPGTENYFSFEDDFYAINQEYDEVFINNHLEREGTQLMILDIGCPKSLMGMREYKKLEHSLSEEDRSHISKYPCSKKFRFGPSRVYESSYRVKFPMKLFF